MLKRLRIRCLQWLSASLIQRETRRDDLCAINGKWVLQADDRLAISETAISGAAIKNCQIADA